MTPPENAIREESAATWHIPLKWWPQMAALALIGLEMCWVEPWFRLVMQISHVPSIARTVVVLGGIMAVGYTSSVIIENLRLRMGVRLILLIILFFLCFFFGGGLLLEAPLMKVVSDQLRLNPGTVLSALAITWVWWRGVGLGRQAIKPVTALRSFTLGLLLYTALVIVSASSGQPLVGLWSFTIFLLIGLIAGVFSRVALVGISQGVHKNPFDRRWLTTTAIALMVTVGLSSILGTMVAGQPRLLFEGIAEGLRLLFGSLFFIVSLPFLGLGYLISAVTTYFIRLGNGAASTPDPRVTATPGADFGVPPQLYHNVEPISANAQVVIFWGLVLLILVILFLRVRNRNTAYRKRLLDEPESLLRKGEARKLLQKALEEAAGALSARLHPMQRIWAAQKVRRIYAQLMDLCTELRYPRDPGQTPLEFLPDLGELLPEVPTDLKLVTEAYVRVRYGELPETAGEVAELEAAWAHIQAEGQRVKRAGVTKLKTAESIDGLRERTGV